MEKIFVSINNEKIELQGQEKIDFIEQRKLDFELSQSMLKKVEEQKNKREIAIAKLESLGLTADDLKALGF